MQVSTNKNLERFIETTQGKSASAGIYTLMIVFKDLRDLLGCPKEFKNKSNGKWYTKDPAALKGPHKLFLVKNAFTPG